MLSKLKIKYIQSLGQKKLRDEHGVFLAEGPRTVTELLMEPQVVIMEIFALEEWINANKKLIAQVPVTGVTESELERLSSLSTPNQVLAVVRQFNLPGPGFSPAPGITLALDTIRDPGNLGTIIRIADWFGVKRMLCSEGTADMYNPKVVQATMGSIARVEVFYTDLPRWLSAQGQIPIYAAALEGEDVTTMERCREGIILIGNESRGIDPSLQHLATRKITIPRAGKAESLNAAVATGIILSHLV